jgi:hypothetical protein
MFVEVPTVEVPTDFDSLHTRIGRVTEHEQVVQRVVLLVLVPFVAIGRYWY